MAETYAPSTGVYLHVGRGDRCARVTYDGDHHQFPVIENVYVGGAGQQIVNGETFACGATSLGATASYDYALQAVTSVTDVNGGVTDVYYDGFGRMKRMHAPSAVYALQSSSAPTLLVEYHLPDETGRPVSML